MNAVIYIRRPAIAGNGGDQLGSFWGDLSHQLIGAGVSQGTGLLAGWLQGHQQGGAGHSGCNQTLPMHDGGAIAGCIDELSAQYHAAEAAGASTGQLLQIAQTFLTTLNDPNAFAQGSDPYLAQAKAVFAHTIQVLTGQIAPGGSPQPVVTLDPHTGQPVTTPAGQQPPIFAGIDMETVLLGGGALLVLWTVLR